MSQSVSESVPAAAAQDGHTIGSEPVNQAPNSPAFSTTSTAGEGGSSPVLPPLPAPKINGRTLDLLKTPPSDHRSTDTRYFTASWGSPYQASSSQYQDLSPVEGLHRKTFSNESSEASPLRRLSIYTPYLRPAPELEEAIVEGPVSASVLANRARRPVRGLTEDWIRQHTANDLAAAERLNWFGDDKEDDENSSLSSSISEELENWVTHELDPRTPTLKSFIERRQKTGPVDRRKGHLRLLSQETVTPGDFGTTKRETKGKMAAHSRNASAVESLDGLGKYPLGRPRSATTSTSPIDKPLPPRPQPDASWLQDSLPEVEERQSEVPEWRQAAITTIRAPTPPPKESPADSAQWKAASLPHVETEALKEKVKASTPPLPTPRIKKKVPWKAGKSILVLLPTDEERGQPGKAPQPLTQKDVENIQRDWEQLGYNTKGFTLESSGGDDIRVEGQSRAVWPDSEAVQQERGLREFKVSIPNREQWDSYVRELSEAKLRALGVSFGDEDPLPVALPLAPVMSRKASMQYPALPFSPPIPTSSANSSHAAQHHPFSPMLMPGAGQSTSQSSNVGSVASPASMHAHMYGKFNPRQSVSFGAGENVFGSPFQFPGQQSPGVWSPQAMPFQPGHLPRGASPSISISNRGSIVSPGSPFAHEGYFPQNDIPMQMQLQQRQQQLQHQLQQQMHRQSVSALASPMLQDVHEDDRETIGKSPSKTPEAFAQPKTKHNASDSLQKEIDDAEYHLEEQFQRQLEHDDYSPHSEKDETTAFGASSKQHSRNQSSFHANRGGLGQSRFAEMDEGPMLHHPQPHSRGHSLSQRTFESDDILKSKLSSLANNSKLLEHSDLDFSDSGRSGRASPDNRANKDSHKKTFSNISNPWAESDTGSASNLSMAKRPGHSVKPSLSKLNVEAPEFKFNPQKASQPSQFSFGAPVFQPGMSVNSTFAPPFPAQTSDFNFSRSVGARPFQPSKINVDAPAFTPGQREFSFSSSGPTFRPDAPAFTPFKTMTLDSVETGASKSAEGSAPRSSSIFGNIENLLDIVKPPKKSKAVPIIRPDSTAGSLERGSEDETMEGKDGRITQGEARFKRARGEARDGDSVPLFAEPSMPLKETSREQSPPKEVAPVDSKTTDSIDQENIPNNDQHLWDTQSQGDSEKLFEPSPVVIRGTSSFKFNPDAKPVEFKFNAAAKPVEFSSASTVTADMPKRGHKKSNSSLSALAKPFEFGQSRLKFEPQSEIKTHNAEEDLAPLSSSKIHDEEPSKPAVLSANTVAPPRTGGLASSRFASAPPKLDESPVIPPIETEERSPSPDTISQPQSSPRYEYKSERSDESDQRIEPSFEEIDAVMRHMNEVESERAASSQQNITEMPRFHQPSPMRQIQIPGAHENSSPIRFLPQNLMRSDAPSPSPGRFDQHPRDLPRFGNLSHMQEDPFVGASSRDGLAFESPIHRLNTSGDVPASDWDDVLSAGDEDRFESRTQFFDGHVNQLISGIVTDKLNPMHVALETIQHTLSSMSIRGTSSRRRRSFSAEVQESDADDEDDFESARRSLSPRRDRKMEKIRNIVTEALLAHYRASTPRTEREVSPEQNSDIIRTLEEMKEQFGQSMRLDFRAEDLQTIVEQAVEKRMPPTPTVVVDEAAAAKVSDLESRIADLTARNTELKVKLQRDDSKAEEEIKSRRAAEDRLAEVQRLLRISSEEEDRLREAVDAKENKMKELEDSHSRITVRTALLEATADSAHKNHTEAQSKLNNIETELRKARQQAQHWQVEAERVSQAAKKHSEENQRAHGINNELRVAIERIKLQMQESMHTRESMRSKLSALQQGMAQSAHEVTEENARRFKKEQELLARQEVLDARLQAEARTRERLEREIERLEEGERGGMRAVKDAQKLEELLANLRVELNEAEKNAMRYKREFEEARESGMSEVQRTRKYMQSEVDAANNQVNLVRQELEEQLSRARTELEDVRLEVDTAKAQTEMLVEEVKESKAMDLKEMSAKHGDVIEDLKTRYERDLTRAVEDAARNEQHLLERISLSAAKMEHLQDRVSHLEEKLEIAKEAALAAAQSARSQVAAPAAVPVSTSRDSAKASVGLPEKISPQALRESIMVLQEQLQAREVTIESLNAQVSALDPEAPTKIAKRDDEIVWLRELLSVRIGDLQDIISTCGQDDFDPIAVKDAAIRLKANLQMEEQERERALNGGSSILPSLLKEAAASPRVAQVVGPMAAAWGNWRQNRASTSRNIGEVLNADVITARSTPSKPSPGSERGFLSGLLTPPSAGAGSAQSAFGNTGRRFTPEQLANRPKGPPPRTLDPRAIQAVAKGKASMGQRQQQPSTPTMMRTGSYDMNGRAPLSKVEVEERGVEERDGGDFGDDSFFDEDADDADADEIEDTLLGR